MSSPTFRLNWPCDVEKYNLTQYFGENLVDFYSRLGLEGHNGTDFSCPNGTPIYATHDGDVTTPPDGKQSDTAGRVVRVVNKELGILTVYFHLKQVLVASPQKVKTGDLIAYSDNTGMYTTGPHLHFGLYLIDEYCNVLNYNNGYHGAVDPIPYLIKPPQENEIIKNKLENQCYLVKNGKRWWLENEKLFELFMGYPVNKSIIKVVDIITFNAIPFGGVISNKR